MFRKWIKRFRLILRLIAFLIVIWLLIPGNYRIPVSGATISDWNHETFWFYPWGESGTHKGIDVFAERGAQVISSSPGIIWGKGSNRMGGNYVKVLGPNLRVHYYAHLDKHNPWMFTGRPVLPGAFLGTVGTSGNAIGKHPHLHYEIRTWVPFIWQMRFEPQGWKKIWYVNPTPLLLRAERWQKEGMFPSLHSGGL